MVDFFFVFSSLRWEVIVGFVDMCGIVGYHCLNSLFIYKTIGNNPVLLTEKIQRDKSFFFFISQSHLGLHVWTHDCHTLKKVKKFIDCSGVIHYL